MPRRPRNDAPDTWHHVMNRGVARRPVFENDRDRRYFLALLAREARAGHIEIVAFCLMLNHFHILIRSVTGQLGRVMQRVQLAYSRWFNRSRRRDGPLWRGRYLSCHVETLRYRRRVVTYIHDNPVKAGLVADPTHHQWTSARCYAGAKRPRWLATEWVDAEIAARGAGDSPAERLATAFPSRLDDDFRQAIEKRLSLRPHELEDEDVPLKHAGSPRVVRWAIRKTKLADGTRPFRPVLAPNEVEKVLARARRKVPRLLGYFKRRSKDAWCVLRAGLLRLLAGCTHREIGLRVDRHTGTISHDLADHRRLFDSQPEYAALTSRLAHAALAA